MPTFKYDEIDGKAVVRVRFNDTKSEQAWMKIAPRKLPEGFANVLQWGPGYTSTNRAEERYISELLIYTAPIVDGKPAMNLGEPPKGETNPPVEPLSEVP